MTYNDIEIGNEPTLEMVTEYINLRGYDLNAREIYIKLHNSGWKKRNGKPIKKLESMIDAINRVYVSCYKKKKPKRRNKVDKKETNKNQQKKKTYDYSELLKDPRWQKRRLEIMQRDNFTCKMCGCGLNDGIPLNVHHCVYHKGCLPWEYLDIDLITLCENCHKKLHNK